MQRKSGSSVSSDAYFQTIATAFTTFTDPLVYAIGDNEWTDCHRANNGGYNPLDRLARIRQLFFANPGTTLGGQQLRIKDQKDYPENQQGVPWFSTFYGVTPPASLTQVVVDRSIEDVTDATPIDYLRLTIDPASPAVFSWELVNVP